MTNISIDLLLGARGWRHEHWRENFYPEDLPEEWWFSYYSNEFRSVLVPFDYLQNIPVDEIRKTVQEWIDDTDEGFRFFIELPWHISLEDLMQVLEPLTPQLGGVCLTGMDKLSNGNQDISHVEAVIKNVQHVAPDVVDWQGLDNKLLSIAQGYQLGCYWQPEENLLNQCNARLAIAEVTHDSVHNPKTLKNIIEHCFSVQGATTIGLFLGGNTPDIEELRNAIMIWQMMV